MEPAHSFLQQFIDNPTPAVVAVLAIGGLVYLFKLLIDSYAKRLADYKEMKDEYVKLVEGFKQSADAVLKMKALEK